jgi:hypothetical protein
MWSLYALSGGSVKLFRRHHQIPLPLPGLGEGEGGGRGRVVVERDLLQRVQRLLQVLQDILHHLDPNRHAHQPFDADVRSLLRAQRAMGGVGWVEDQRVHVAQRGGGQAQAQRFEEAKDLLLAGPGQLAERGKSVPGTSVAANNVRRTPVGASHDLWS